MTHLVLNGKPPEVSTVPDLLLPAQVPFRRRLGPAQLLMLAVLDDAIAEYRRLVGVPGGARCGCSAR